MIDPEMPLPSYAESPPKFIAGAPAIDFLNTVEWRGDPSRFAERLTSYTELVIWCRTAGLLTEAEARRLTAEAERHPQAARRILRTAIGLREAVVAFLRSPPSDDAAMDQLNRCFRGSRFEHRIERAAAGRLRRVTIPVDSVLRLALDRLIQEIVAVLTADAPGTIRSCTNRHCGWFFIDASRNSARRWCRMATCGNQAKARTHYARQRNRS